MIFSNAIKFAAVSAMVALGSGAFTSLSQAQQVYRIVGPDGKVTFSDQPPPVTSNAKVTAAGAGGAGGIATASLPFELRKVVAQYPVTLYTGANCAPCASARTMLNARGIPFAEKTISTNEDQQALQRLSGDSSLPFLTIGSQQLKGFSDAEWAQFLDAAGYPKSSVLPANYIQTAATPLVTVSTAAAPAPATAARTNTPAAAAGTPAAPAPSNPAGIRF